MKNAITVDLEDWYHVCGVEELSDPENWKNYESRVCRNTEKVLKLLSEYNTKATFFVLGYIAFKEPSLIQIIREEGHELATHGFFHRRVFELTPVEFEEDLKRSIDAISTASNSEVAGFRAPEWSIRPDTFWAFEILARNQIKYDSSLVPLTRMGCRKYPRFPCKIKTPAGDIWEFPLSTYRIFHENLPFSGGLPLRLTPYFYILHCIHKLNRMGRPAVVYLHPWELDREKPVIELPFSRRFMHYFNISATEKKIRGLMKYLKFAPISEVLGLRR